ncbi:MAG: DUF1015 family protein [Gammaproteobacteria bacterium]|nr:DUF1015 family protein [Gammaproteobacteria bacterium]
MGNSPAGPRHADQPPRFRVAPFTALRPVAGRAAETIAPPYDVVSTDEARARVADRPHDFLRVSLPEAAMPPEADPTAAERYTAARCSLDDFLAQGAIAPDAQPAYYVYRVASGSHAQTGVVLLVSVDCYRAGTLRRHELTRPDKETDRALLIQALEAQTGLVMLAHRRHFDLAAVIEEATQAEPDCRTSLNQDGAVTEHSVWPVRDAVAVARITQAVAELGELFIADGHHRVAAGNRAAEAFSGRPEAQWLLGATFPAEELRILDYNRVVSDLNGHTPRAFLAALNESFEVGPSSGPARPGRAGEFGLYLSGGWHRARLRAGLTPDNDPVGSLDVSLLGEHLLAPILGIEDSRTDPRIDFVGGARGLEELERRVDSGDASVAVALYPTPMQALMDVAGAGEIMPPKSTWFEPKLADGLLAYSWATEVTENV